MMRADIPTTGLARQACVKFWVDYDNHTIRIICEENGSGTINTILKSTHESSFSMDFYDNPELLEAAARMIDELASAARSKAQRIRADWAARKSVDEAKWGR